ncbi:MAG: phosphodiester glycosidase family protein [Oscillospiraceae bacterium]|nr:phosphodiester glycosidase family protein [Oscillospiraceae bacterium]
MKRAKKSTLWTKLYPSVLILFTAFVLLDAFVIPRAYIVEPETNSGTDGNSTAQLSSDTEGYTNSDAVSVSASTYSDGNISITITTYREYDTNIYVADITLSDASYLKTAFAEGTFGKNITEKTSLIAEESGAILAINGDYYGAQNSGYVIRNGKIYRDTVADFAQEDLVIYEDGSFGIVTEGSISAEELLEDGAVQVLSFGPGLIENGEVSVSTAEEVDKARVSNPRTAIGQISDLHYILVVSDGRTSESEGLSLSQLAEFMRNLGVTTAYNLDGGGSSTMVFNGSIINNPTTNGKKITERSVSDIVCIAY